MKYFCTYFNFNYILQGWTLFRSLKNTVESFKLFVVCMDDNVFDVLSMAAPKNITLIKLVDIEAFDPEYAACRDNRSIYEYFFTLTPVMPLYIFQQYPEIDLLTYLDADLYFYNSPQPLYDELGNHSMLIIPHRFPQRIKWREKFGIYNVSLQIYKRNENTMKALLWWREKCIEWCYDIVEKERFADQKYLNHLILLFDEVIASRCKGAGLAPWNWYQYHLECDCKRKLIDGEDLIFYHFQGFKVLNSFLLQHNLGHYGRVMPRNLRKFFYLGYLQEVYYSMLDLKEHFPQYEYSLVSRHNRNGMKFLRKVLSAIYHRTVMFYSFYRLKKSIEDRDKFTLTSKNRFSGF